MILSLNSRVARRFGTGFTLVELMVAVAIVAILAAIAYPSYRSYVLRGQIVNATNGLSSLRANMERYYQDNRTYVSTGTFTSPCLAAASSLLVGTFQMSCTSAPSATAYQLQAAGSGSTTGFTFFVDQNNNQSTTVAASVGGGWNTCTSAWVTRPAAAC